MTRFLRNWLLGTKLPTRRGNWKEAVQCGLLTSVLAPVSYYLFWNDPFSVEQAAIIAAGSALAMTLAIRLIPVIAIYE